MQVFHVHTILLILSNLYTLYITFYSPFYDTHFSLLPFLDSEFYFIIIGIFGRYYSKAIMFSLDSMNYKSYLLFLLTPTLVFISALCRYFIVLYTSSV